jgi:DNA mismatch endonuclease (patch repair protein)
MRRVPAGAAGKDRVTPEQRSANMARVRGRDTGIELAVRRALHLRGVRSRLHDAALPGRPDLVFPGRRAVIFVHGCFWHAHGCRLSARPTANAVFWSAKLARNRARDEASRMALLAAGWRVLTVWECALRGRDRLGIERVAEACAVWLRSDAPSVDVPGTDAG